MTQVANVMGDASGVPYIIIGDKSYSGYSDAMSDEILNQIKTEYAATDKYDVMDHLSEASAKTKAKNDSTAVTIILVFIVIAGGICFNRNGKQIKIMVCFLFYIIYT